MVRTKLENIFLKNRNEENKINYNKQRNLCVTLLRKSRRDYYQNLSAENVCDNKNSGKKLNHCCLTKLCPVKR